MKKLSDTGSVITCGAPIRVDVMAHRICRTALSGALALAVSFAGGCTVDTETGADDALERGADDASETGAEETGAEETSAEETSAENASEDASEDASERGAEDVAASETEEGEDVAQAEQEINACSQVYAHGGNLWEQDYSILMGCGCGPGFVRDYYNVWNTGAGSCNALGWATPDPNDCRVLVHIHDAAFWAWGNCNVQVEKKALCPHNKCTTGGPLSPSCSPAVASICNVDPYCCTTAWDSICVNEVRTVTNSLACPIGTCGHSLCSTGVKLTSGCDMPPAASSCAASICAVDPYCCNNSWDSICVGEVSSVCGKTCN